MRYGRRVAFQGVGAISLFNDCGLKLHGIHMVRHAAKVHSRALFALVRDLLDMDRAELVLEALWLARGELATRLDHVDSDALGCLGDDVDDAQIVTVWLRARQQIAGLVICPASQLVHRDVHRKEVKCGEQACVHVLLHVAPG